MNTNETVEITDLEAPNAEEIKGGPVVNEYLVLNAIDESGDDAGHKPTGVTVKIRKPGK